MRVSFYLPIDSFDILTEVQFIERILMSQKRIQLEDVATDSVQRSGLHNLSFRTLADEVGVKSSSVHYYFPEKSHLAGALIEKYTLALAEKLAAIDSSKNSPVKKLEAFVKIFDDVIKAEKFCLCGMLAAEVATLNDANRKLLRGYFQLAESWLYQIFQEHADSLSLALKPRTLARIVMSGLEGAILLDRVDGSRDRLRGQREFIRALFS
jgi:TetR/AcrR family transcriptional repressor of nem operon